MMKSNTWTMSEAQEKFETVVEAACAGDPQIIAEDGKPIAAVVNVEYWDKYRQKDRPSLGRYLQTMPKDDGDFERIHVKPRDVEF